jgi:hypothetical protein
VEKVCDSSNPYGIGFGNELAPIDKGKVVVEAEDDDL